ncbi:MAG: hypothetical protein JW797_16730 [Bradymonadales bacterium]|nr:hypothetical protein [Bradymonadales bacterium]
MQNRAYKGPGLLRSTPPGYGTGETLQLSCELASCSYQRQLELIEPPLPVATSIQAKWGPDGAPGRDASQGSDSRTGPAPHLDPVQLASADVVQMEIDLEEAMSRAEREWPDWVLDKITADGTKTLWLVFKQAGPHFNQSNEAILEYYKRIVRSDAPGHTALRDDVASALEAACREYETTTGLEAPRGSGFGWRKGVFGSHNRHPLGAAIDYDSTRNPHIDLSKHYGREVDALLELATGESNEADLPGQNSNSYLDTVQSEAERLLAASENFRNSLGDQVDELLEARRQYFIAEDDDDDGRERAMARAQSSIKVWLTAIGRALDAIDLIDPARDWLGRLERLEADLATWEEDIGAGEGVVPEDFRGRLQRVVDTTEDAAIRSRADEYLQVLPEARTFHAELELRVNSPIPALQYRHVLGYSIADDYRILITYIETTYGGLLQREDDLRNLRDRLTGDPRFLFGRREGRNSTTHRRECLNPPAAQLVEDGFFNMLPLFMRAVANHGFGMGMSWHGPDCMHIEYPL